MRARGSTRAPAPRQGAADGARSSGKMLRTLPLDQLEELRDIAPYYYDWLHHPPEDPFWNFAELRGKYGRTRAAVLNLSGWNDDNYGPEGAITNYLGLVEARGGQPDRAPRCSRPMGARRRRDRADQVRRPRFRPCRRDRLRRGRARLDGPLRPRRPQRRVDRRRAVFRDGRQPVEDVGHVAAAGTRQHLLPVAGEPRIARGAHAGAAGRNTRAEHVSSPTPTIR